MPLADTKERILDAAERLFAEHGFAATSLRALTAEAGVNLAAVHYHFGSKEGLIGAVFARRLEPLNDERLRRLDLAEAKAGSEGPTLEEVLETLIGPALRISRDPSGGGAMFMRLLGRTYTEPGDLIETIFKEQFSEVQRRFQAAVMRAVPGLTEVDFFWKMHFTIGVMAYSMADHHRLAFLSDGRLDGSDPDRVLAQLVPFLAAGFRSGVTSTNGGAHA